MSKKSMLVLGMMSGTSADGIDTALVRISSAPPNLKIKLLGHTNHQFPTAIRKEILRVAEQNPLTPGEFSQLHARLGQIYAQTALAACKQFRTSPKKIDLIGNHGQTIFHQGAPTNFLGSPTASTLQLGDGSIIANLTGITTVSDFRPADIALGGQGAPLVPFADYVLYRDKKLGRVSLNIGGIANLTVIPAGARPSDVLAFDTGPGNMLIDALVQHFTHGRQRYDKGAAFARQGRVNRELVARLIQDPYFDKKPPKSTGREYFGAAYVERLLALARRYKVTPADLVFTATLFTAITVSDAFHRFVVPKTKIDQIILSGGGARNPLLFGHLSILVQQSPRTLYANPRPSPAFVGVRMPASARTPVSRSEPPRFVSVLPSSHYGIPTDAKEALAFAILAYETFHQRPSNIPSATGASKLAILGNISYAPPS